ncbi:MAG TPA: hypothetical protein PLL68_15690 [Ornithinibacter sp.]|nr:hypothetical protein [Ornithinibacter sp.]
MGVQEGLALLFSGGDLAGWTPPVWLEVVGALGMPLALIGGPLLAWRVHGRHLQWRDLVAAVVGALLGSAVFGVVMLVLVPLTRLVQGPAMDEQGPWLAGAVAALAVVAFLAKPVAAAVRDLTGAKEHARRHGLRLAIVAVGLVAIIASVFVGGETAELGAFLLLPAVPAVGAVGAMDWWRDNHPSTTAE